MKPTEKQVEKGKKKKPTQKTFGYEKALQAK